MGWEGPISRVHLEEKYLLYSILACRELTVLQSKKEQEMKEEHTWRHLCKWKQLVRSKEMDKVGASQANK